MFDIKHMDEETHKALTGVSNIRILDHVQRISELGVPLHIRIPVIPTLNDQDENIIATARFVREHVSGAFGIELLPYHQLGLNKYEALGISYTLSSIIPPTTLEMERLENLVIGEGVQVIMDEAYPDAREAAASR